MNSFADVLRQLGPSRLAIMGAIFVGLLMFFIFISLRVSAPSMKLLYADLNTTDSGAVAAALEKNQISYTVSADGSSIQVSETEVGRARMLLAAEGLPNGGSLGYELFDDQSGFGTTNFVQNINQVRALEGELSRTISSLENIRSARVHLVLPKRELFSRESRESRASVFLGIRSGIQLPREQIVAIQSLIASSVAELKIANVSVIDSNGNLLAKGGEDDANLMSAKAEEMRRNYESRLTSKVEDQIGRVVGFGKVRATITAEVNFDRINTNEELFDPEGQVVRSTQTTEESNLEREPPNDNVTVDNNLPGVGGDFLVNQEPSLESSRLEEVTNFEISRTVRNTVREVGEISRLSVAVLVDGRYIVDGEGNKTYEPRSEEELQQIETLVRSSIGYDEMRGDNIEVVNLQFAEVDTGEDLIDEQMLFGFNKADLLDTAEILTIAIMIVLVVLLVLQPMVNRLVTSEGGEIDEEFEADLLAASPANPALAAPDGQMDPNAMEIEGATAEESLINVSGVDGKVKASSLKKVEEIVENYPDETVAVIRSWMTSEN